MPPQPFCVRQNAFTATPVHSMFLASATARRICAKRKLSRGLPNDGQRRKDARSASACPSQRRRSCRETNSFACLHVAATVQSAFGSE